MVPTIFSYKNVYNDQALPERKIEIKTKNLVSPLITQGLRKNSRKKQPLYNKFFQQRNSKNKKTCNVHRYLFERSKK